MRLQFVKPEIVRLSIGDGDNWIEVKKRLSVGEARKVMVSFVGTYTQDGSRTPNEELLGMGQTLAYLVAWNARDDEDRPVDVSLDALKALDQRSYALIEKAIEQHIANVILEDAEREKKIPASTAPAASATS